MDMKVQTFYIVFPNTQCLECSVHFILRAHFTRFAAMPLGAIGLTVRV